MTRSSSRTAGGLSASLSPGDGPGRDRAVVASGASPSTLMRRYTFKMQPTREQDFRERIADRFSVPISVSSTVRLAAE